MDLALALLALAKRMRSSAKSKCEIPKFFLEAFSGIHSFFLQLSLMRNPRYSMQSMNKYGERESSCHIPLVGLKNFSLPPLKRIEVVVDETQLIISLIISSGNRKFFKDVADERPFKTIISLNKINFDSHKTHSTLLLV